MQLGWIDFSREQRNKVLSVIHLLSEPTAVDELGIGAIRDGFADIFFPGTSTIQTRSKYFILVPAILAELEQVRNLKPDTMLKMLHEVELDLIDVLLENSPPSSIGIIGEDARRNLKRKPSEIYWNGLRTFGIFCGNRMSILECCKMAYVLQEQKKNAAALGNARNTGDENDSDDGRALASGIGGLWRIPPLERNWNEVVSITLTATEATFLKERILKSVPHSLLAFVLESDRYDFVQYGDFDELATLLPALPAGLTVDYTMARGFMNFIYGAYIRYNMMLCSGEDEDCRDDWEQWVGGMPAHASIDLNALAARLSQTGVRIDSRLQHFLNNIQADMHAGDIMQMDRHIMEREFQLKGRTRSKLHNVASQQYKGWVGIRKLVYRLPSAQRIVADIFEGEGGKNVRGHLPHGAECCHYNRWLHRRRQCEEASESRRRRHPVFYTGRTDLAGAGPWNQRTSGLCEVRTLPVFIPRPLQA